MTMPIVPSLNLADGRHLPALAYGTGTAWHNRKGHDTPLNRELVDLIKEALKAGFTYIDTAEMYATEREVGVAIQEWCEAIEGKQPNCRDKLFIATKVWDSLPDVDKAFQASLKRLGLRYVDLYLIHAPVFRGSFEPITGQALRSIWQALEALVDQGLIRSLGVSNFRVSDLQELMAFARIKPVVNQIELHPYCQQRDITQCCKDHNIVVQCYGPLTPITRAKEGPVAAVAEELGAKYGKTAAQVLLRWGLQKGHALVTTTSQPQRLKEYLAVPDFELTEEEVLRIDEEGEAHPHRAFWVGKNVF